MPIYLWIHMTIDFKDVEPAIIVVVAGRYTRRCYFSPICIQRKGGDIAVVAKRSAPLVLIS